VFERLSGAGAGSLALGRVHLGAEIICNGNTIEAIMPS